MPPREPSEDFSTIALPALLFVILLVVYSPALLSPGLIDEQYLLAWLKSAPKLHGSSGISGLMMFPGLAAPDSWGASTKLCLLLLAFFAGKNMLLARCFMLALHGVCSSLVYSCSRHLRLEKAPALIAAILFALYPLHFEAVAWLGGIGSTLATLFFLLALQIYLQARNNTARWVQIAQIGALSLLSITSSALIWPACLAFALVELVYFSMPDESEEPAAPRDLSLGLIVLLMPVIITGSYLAAIGGINAAFLPDLRMKYISSFLRHSFIPINEINWKHYSKEYLKYYAFYPFFVLSLLSGIFFSRELRRSAIFSILLFFLLALPVVGIACVDSNLYGERWLYPASAALSIFLACGTFGFAKLSSRLGPIGIVGAGILSFVLAIFFGQQLSNENSANRNFARVLKAVQKSLRTKQEKTHLNEYLIADLPEKISVCPQYAPRGPVLIDTATGFVRSNPVPDGRYKELLAQGKLRDESWRWDDRLKTIMPLDISEGKAVWPEKLNADLFAGRMMPAVSFYKNMHMSPDRAELVMESNTAQGPVISIDPSDLSTIDGDYLYLDAQIEAPKSLPAPRVEMYWKTRVHTDYEKRDRFAYANAITNDDKFHRYLLSLRSNGWTTGGLPSLAAIGFPANSHVRLREAGLLRLQKNELPQLKPVLQDCANTDSRRFTPPYYNYPVDAELGLVALSDRAEALLADYSVSETAGATGVSVELSYPNQSFSDANSNHLSGQMYKTFSVKGLSGRISVPIADLPESGVYSLRVIARDSRGVYLGQFSDALCYQVAKVRKEN